MVRHEVGVAVGNTPVQEEGGDTKGQLKVKSRDSVEGSVQLCEPGTVFIYSLCSCKGFYFLVFLEALNICAMFGTLG